MILHWFIFIKNKWRYIIGGFLLGFILNFHPITGLGGILIWFLLLFANKYLNQHRITLLQIAASFVAIFIGMFPFILVYFTKTEIALDYDPILYQEAINERIAPFFFDTGLFLEQWLKTRYLFYVVPMVFLLFWTFIKAKEYFKNSCILASISILLIVIPTISIPLEQ